MITIQKNIFLRACFALLATQCFSARAMDNPAQLTVQEELVYCPHCEDKQPLVQEKKTNPLAVFFACGHGAHKVCVRNYLKHSRTQKCNITGCNYLFSKTDKQKIEANTYIPDSLFDLCAAQILKNTLSLVNVVTAMPDDVVNRLISLIPPVHPRNPYIKPLHISWNAALEMAVDSPTIDISRACGICLKYKYLTYTKLFKRVAQYIRNNESLSEAMLNLIFRSFNVNSIVHNPFHALLPQGSWTHKQAGQLAYGFFKQHVKEIQKGNSHVRYNCFMLEPYNDEMLQDCLFSCIPMEANYQAKLVYPISKESISIGSYSFSGCFDERLTATPMQAALSCDSTLLAIHSPGFQVIEIHKTLPTSKDNAQDTRLMLACECNLLNISEITFAQDNKWLRIKDTEGTNCYFQLPTDYLAGHVTLEQIVFIKILHELTCTWESSLPHHMGIIQKLLACKVFESFKDAEKNMLAMSIKTELTSNRAARSERIRNLATTHFADGMLKELMFEYFYPNELKFLGDDLAHIGSTGLKKKMCRYMIELLEKHYLDKDFSSYKIHYAKGKDLKSEVTWALWHLWEQYLTLQNKMTPEEFKTSVLVWIEEALEHQAAMR